MRNRNVCKIFLQSLFSFTYLVKALKTILHWINVFLFVSTMSGTSGVSVNPSPPPSTTQTDGHTRLGFNLFKALHCKVNTAAIYSVFVLICTAVHCCSLLYTVVHYCTLYTAVHYCSVHLINCCTLLFNCCSILYNAVHHSTLIYTHVHSFTVYTHEHFNDAIMLRKVKYIIHFSLYIFF